MAFRARALVLVVAVGGASLALALAGALPGVDFLGSLFGGSAPALDAPPSVSIVAPVRGAGNAGALLVSGVALDDRSVAGVEVRLDHGVWVSANVSARSAGGAAWAHAFEGVLPGLHVVEARAFDGAFVGARAAAIVKQGEARRPPTVAIVDPEDGSGVAGSGFTLSGAAASPGAISRVVVSVDGREVGEARVVPPGASAVAWSFDFPAGSLAPGVRDVRVVAFDAGEGPDAESAPQSIRIGVARAGPAPAVRVLAPTSGAGAVAGASSPACAASGACVLVSGVVSDPSSLATGASVSVDGSALRPLSSFPGATFTRLGPQVAWSFEWPTRGEYAGEHEIVVRAETPEGPSAPARVLLALASERALRIETDAAPGDPTLVARWFRAAWPDGSTATAPQWRVDGALRAGDGVGVLHVDLARPGWHEVAVLAFDAEGRGARSEALVHSANRAPVARFADPALVATNVPVALSGAASSDPDGRVVSWCWELGDATPAACEDDATIAHAFARAGRYVVNLTVVDDAGARSAVWSRALDVGNALPVVDFSWTPAENATRDSLVRFTDLTSDPDGPVTARSWDFGDGTDSAAASPAHRFPGRGVYAVRLTVWDAAGASVTRERHVTIENLPPTPAFSWEPRYPRALEPVRFQDLSQRGDGPFARHEWDFGDGSTGTGATPVTSWARPGNYTVLLRVTDDVGDGASVVDTIVVGNAPPQVDMTFRPPHPRSFDPVLFESRSVDPDGSIARVRWDFGDGGTSDLASPSHLFVAPGAYTVRLTVVDDLGLRAEREFTVEVENLPPRAEIVAPAEFAYAGVPTKLDGSASDPDGYVASARWEIVGDGGAHAASVDGLDAEHVFPFPGVYRLRLVAVDDAGGETVVERDVEAGVAPTALFPPVILVEFPDANASFSGAVRFSGTATSVAPLERVEVSFRRGNLTLTPFAGPWALAAGKERWTFDFDSRVVENGPLLVIARVTDARGARAEARIPVEIANEDLGEIERMTLTVTSHRPGERVEGAVVLRGYAHHPQGLLSVRARVDDGPWREADGAPASWSLPLDTLALKNGPHKVTIRAFRSPVVHRETVLPLVVENLAPLLEIDRGVPSNASGVVEVTGRLADEGPSGVVEWRLDSSPWRVADGTREWSFPVDTRALENGPHVLRVRAVRDGGLSSPTHEARFHVSNAAIPDEVETRSSAQAPREAPPAGAGLALVAAALAAFAGRRREP